MRINHNIAALNTYSQLTNNTTNTTKSLEKLSSGLRINRAGDDAAGLAISEKMRAQIRGLDQASRNAQDGISMLQTAEGALNEIHSILQRMRELATQAASDTNVDVDREEIQKEINQLTSEINRIGNTTEFNTKKLLDGGTTKTAVTTVTKGVAVSKGAAAVTVNTGSDTGTQVGGATVVEDTQSELATAGVYSFSITNAFAAGDTFSVDGLTSISFGNGSGDIDVATAGTALTQTAAIATYISNHTAAGEIGEKYAVSYTGTTLTLTQKSGFVSATAPALTATGTGTVSTVTTTTPGDPAVAGQYTVTVDTPFTAGESITVGGKTFTFGSGAGFDIDTDTAVTAEQQAAALETAIRSDADLSVRFGTTANAAGASFTLTEAAGEETGDAELVVTPHPEQISGDYDIKVTKQFQAGEKISFGGETFTAVASGANAANGQFAVGASIEEQTESLRAAVEARLGTRFTVTRENDTLNLVEKAGQATGEDLAITKTGNVQGSISFKNTAQSSRGTAAEWNTGEVTALEDDTTGAFTFNGVTVNVTTGAVAGATSDAANRSVSIGIANGATAADTATAILNALNDYKANGGDELDDFTFAGDETGITITDATEADTQNAVNGDGNNNLVIGTTNLTIANTSNATQLVTAGEDSRSAEYTFEITSAFKENEAITIGDRKFIGVSGEANALLGEFSINGSKEDQAASLRAAIEATTALNSRYEVTISGARITLTERVAGQETAALTAPATELTKGTAGVYSFKTQVVSEGQVYKIDGISIKVVSDAEKYHDEIAAGTAMLAGSNAKEQAENLRTAINLNASLSEKYLAESSSDTVKLTQQTGTESVIDPAITVEKEGVDGKFVANFQIGANTGQSMTVEIGDVRAVALKISGTEAGLSVSAKNGAEASYVTTASVSNGTDNTSIEFALDVSDHTKASAAISVVQDAIDKVSAERSQMGAYQNRLEHTINNLGTSSENLTAAESRIRDVDMAKEMTEFTKNNILSQAAQAMLAQANQQPQGVLQLLQ